MQYYSRASVKTGKFIMFVHSYHWLLFCGALMGFVGVAAGAFGAHALKHRLTPEMLSVFEVGVRYQMYHALAIVAAAFITTSFWALLAGSFFIGGTLIFSGSLYLLTLTDVRAWGAVTPIGGAILLLGWLSLMIAALQKSS